MAALQCEICGGKLIGKSAGRFVCDSCGMEYDSSWVKEKVQEIKGKVQIEGPVEVTGTVKIDGPVGGANVESLLIRGYNALKDKDFLNARSFFDQVLNMDAKNIDAYLGIAMIECKSDTKEAFLRAYSNGDVGNDSTLKHVKEYADYDLSKKLKKLDELRKASINKRIQKEVEERQSIIRKIAAWREKNICAAACLMMFRGKGLIGLKEDGSVVGTIIDSTDDVVVEAIKTISSWHSIVAIAITNNETVIGLNCDGTVRLAGYYDRDLFRNVLQWDNIAEIKARPGICVGLKRDGTVVTALAPYLCNDVYDQPLIRKEVIANWNNIIAIETDADTVIALQADGNVVSEGRHAQNYAYKAGEREDTIVIDIADGKYLMADGTVRAVGSRNEYSEWTNIVALSGVTLDGTLCKEVPYGRLIDWQNVIAFARGSYFNKRIDTQVDYAYEVDYAYGLHSDGTISMYARIWYSNFLSYETRNVNEKWARTNNPNLIEPLKWKLFENVDTLRDSRKRMIERGASIGPSKNNERLKELQTLEEEKKKKQLLLDDLRPRRNIFNESKILRMESRLEEIDKRTKQLYEGEG